MMSAVIVHHPIFYMNEGGTQGNEISSASAIIHDN